ncbi:MAG: 1-(5-phosphoribosyl)-5-[(5-phosphoribosylamino)methylideneamino]imidazole-4-carboxamide isomerase [Actinobacteria bacterium]|nr:1-(5-phosphoribosyl)-5-[(5-phosphoribosylamino)methylideneamino]imidazole-4-carboxamide isomerase [Actinomycetota bacterium]
MDVYAAIDIRDGQCVRLTQGDFTRETVYFKDPVEAARHWLAQGARWLHVVDLDGARRGTRANADMVRRVLSAAGDTPVQVSGGLRSIELIGEALSDGAARVVVGTAAVRDPDLLQAATERFPGRVAVGVDAKDGVVVVEGWGASGAVDVATMAERAASAGAAAIVYTDVQVDGTLAHPNVAVTADLVQKIGARVPVIASGGVGSLTDITSLRAIGVAGVIVGRAIYAGAVDLRAAVAAAAGK